MLWRRCCSICLTHQCISFLVLEAMERSWTEETAKAWTARRDAYTRRQRGKTVAELRASNDLGDRKMLRDILESEKTNLLKRAHECTTKIASWEVRSFALSLEARPHFRRLQVQKHSTEYHRAPISGTLHLPHNLHQAYGVSQVRMLAFKLQRALCEANTLSR